MSIISICPNTYCISLLSATYSSLFCLLDKLLFTLFRAKLTPENKHGDTALEVARNWGDEYVYALVYAEASRLPPPPSDGKKGKRMEYVGETERQRDKSRQRDKHRETKTDSRQRDRLIVGEKHNVIISDLL